MSDVTKARAAVWAGIGARTAATARGSGILLASEEIERALDALILAARRDEWATRKGPALLAVVEAALERDGCDEVCSAMKPYRGCTCGAEALDRALASLTRNDEVDRG